MHKKNSSNAPVSMPYKVQLNERMQIAIIYKMSGTSSTSNALMKKSIEDGKIHQSNLSLK